VKNEVTGFESIYKYNEVEHKFEEKKMTDNIEIVLAED
jgi:hypothetical protein